MVSVMKKNNLFLLPVILLVVSCNVSIDKSHEDAGAVIGKKDVEVADGKLTPEILWAFGRVSEPRLSPDKSVVLYGVTWYDVAQNKGNRELYSVKTDGSDLRQLTTTAKGEYDAQWRPDGQRIGFLSAESGSMQIWEMNPDGSARMQVSDIKDGVTGFRYSPDGTKVFYTAEVPVQKPLRELFDGLDKTSGRLMNDMMYRHWDTWVDTWSHIFVADYHDGKVASQKDIMEGEQWDSPLKPFGGTEQIAWSPDGKKLVYACRKLTGKACAFSTNSDLFEYNVADGTTRNLTEGMAGYDLNPVFSPDGRYLAWESMERNGYEADQVRLFILDMTSGAKTYLTEGWDNDVHNLAWDDNGDGLWFTTSVEACDQICYISLNDKKVKVLTTGIHDYQNVIPAGNTLIAARMSMSQPTELYRVDPATGESTELSFTNKELLSKLHFGKPVKRWVKTSDNKDMLTWVVFPPDFDSTRSYPTLLYCQGGPQSTVSQFWSYRWNFQMMVANGYVVVAPNRRGVPGFGKAWNEQISGDYGGQNMKDYFAAIDDVSKESWSDENRLGAVGASYGGFSVYWLAGNHHKRFKAFIAHDGMFNLEQQYLETEEMWFVNWDLGGPYWDKSNATAQRSYANSPHRFVDQWDTPILVIHSELDYRIVASQGMAAFNAAQSRGIPSEYLYFPDENHWVLQPQNGILWQRVFYNWLDRWLK